MIASVITLGCKVNEYESQSILNQLQQAGYEIAEGLIKADVYIINTCAVTNVGEKKSRQVLSKVEKLNPNAKLAEAMRKKTGNGYVLDSAYVQGSTGIIPAGTLLPVKLGTVLGSQISETGDLFIAKAPQNFITKDKYILIYKDSDIKGQVKNVEQGRLFFKNGVLILDSTILVTPNDQAVVFKGRSNVENEKSKLPTRKQILRFIKMSYSRNKI